MTRVPLTLVALVGLASPSAFAAPPTPCTSYAGMADMDNDGFCAFVGTSTAASTGWSGKIDCRDDVRGIHPGAVEVVGDGIDQDCTGRDLLFPVSDPTVARYRVAYGGSWDPAIFVADHNACRTAPECDTDDTTGTMKINPASEETHVFRDIYCGTTKVLGADGIREVVTKAEDSHYRGTTCPTGRVGSGTSASGGGSGVGKPYVDRLAEVLREEAGKLREDVRAADAVLDARVSIIEVDNLDRDVELERLGDVDDVLEGRIAANEDAIVAETIRAQAAENALSGRVFSAESSAASASRKADDAASHGPLIEAGSVGGGIFHRPLETSSGDEIRDSAIGGGGFELRAGVDAKGWQTAGFGQFSFGSDGQGSGSDTALLVGADVLIDAGSAEVGPWLGFLRTEDHVNLLDVSVVENGALVGITLQGDTAANSAARVVPFARLGAGIGYYGTRGSNDGHSTVVSNYGGLGLVQVGVRFGAGALKD